MQVHVDVWNQNSHFGMLYVGVHGDTYQVFVGKTLLRTFPPSLCKLATLSQIPVEPLLKC